MSYKFLAFITFLFIDSYPSLDYNSPSQIFFTRFFSKFHRRSLDFLVWYVKHHLHSRHWFQTIANALQSYNNLFDYQKNKWIIFKIYIHSWQIFLVSVLKWQIIHISLPRLCQLPARLVKFLQWCLSLKGCCFLCLLWTTTRPTCSIQDISMHMFYVIAHTRGTSSIC